MRAPTVTTATLADARGTVESTSSQHVWRWYAVGTVVALAAVFVGLAVGAAGPDWWRVPLAFIDHLPGVRVRSGVTESEWAIVWKVRAPRVALGVLVGAMLSVGGAAYQGVFRNPLVDPYQLGAAAGAGLGATLMLTVFRGNWVVNPVPLVAFVFALAAVAVTYAVGASFGGARSNATLVLAGVAMVSLLTAAQTFLMQRNTEVIREVYNWILGHLNTATWTDVVIVAPYVAVSIVVLWLHRRHLDALRVGDDEAETLGVPVARVRIWVVVAATFGTAAVVAMTGLIGFVGIIVPHLVRLVAGASYRRVIPLSVLFGAAFLVLADVAGRTIIAPAELPIGVVTAFLGAPFFLVLLRTRGIGR